MTTESTIETPPVEPTPWFIEEGRPGVGERPDFLSEKFKSVADLATSYRELEKKLSAPPEEYDISKSKFLDPAYVPFQELLQVAKDKRVPKDVIDKMVDSLDKYMDEFSINPEEEAKALGENAKERLNVLDNWAKANLSEASYHALTNNLKSASAIKALEELRGKMMSNNPVVPNGNDLGANTTATLDDLRAEMSNNLAKYKTDPKYRDDLRARMEIAAKTSNYIDKQGA